LSLSLDRVKEFAEDVTSGMYAKASHLIDGEIVAELTNKENYNNKAIFTIEKKYFDKLDEEDNKNNLVNRILSDIDFLLNPSKNNNKAEALTNSKEESSIIWLVDTKIFNLIRRKFLTPMAQTKYGDFIESLRGVIR
jgi:hypothetical protein